MPEVYYDVTVRANPKSMEELINKVHEAEDAIGDLKKAGGNIGGFGGGGGDSKKDANDLGGTGMGYGFMAQMRAFLKKGLVDSLGYRESKEQYQYAKATEQRESMIPGGQGQSTKSSRFGLSDSLKAGLKMGAIAGVIGLVVGGIKMLGNVIKSIVQQSEVFQSIVNLTLAPFILMVNLMLVPALMMLIPYIIEMFTWVTENKDGLALFGTGFATPMTLLLDAIANNPIVTFTKNFVELLTSISNISSGNLSFADGLWSAFANALQMEFSIFKMNPLVTTLFGPWGTMILDTISAALENTANIGEFWINIQNMWGKFWTDLGNAFISSYNSTIFGELLGKIDNLSYTPISESSDSGFSKSGDTYIFDGIVFNQGDTQYTTMGEALDAHVKSLGGMR